MSPQAKNWAMACHLAALVGYVIPLGWILGPLVVWLVKRTEYNYVDEQGKEAVNFQISLLIYFIISAILCIFLIGIVFLIALGIFQLVMVIVAAVKAANGEHYRYPLSIRFIK